MEDTKPNKQSTDQKDKFKGRHKVDWAAVERDYRTDRFTLRELAERHKVSDAQICRKAKEKSWTKDLRELIRQETDAAVLRETVKEAQKSVANTVLVAAEINKQLIIGHRQDLVAVRDVAVALLSELTLASLLAEDQEILAQVLAGSGAEPVDEARARAAVQKALAIGSRTSSIKQIMDTLDKLQLAQRRAYGIDEKEDKSNPGSSGYVPPAIQVSFVSAPAVEDNE